MCTAIQFVQPNAQYLRNCWCPTNSGLRQRSVFAPLILNHYIQEMPTTIFRTFQNADNMFLSNQRIWGPTKRRSRDLLYTMKVTIQFRKELQCLFNIKRLTFIFRIKSHTNLQKTCNRSFGCLKLLATSVDYISTLKLILELLKSENKWRWSWAGHSA